MIAPSHPKNTPLPDQNDLVTQNLSRQKAVKLTSPITAQSRREPAVLRQTGGQLQDRWLSGFTFDRFWCARLFRDAANQQRTDDQNTTDDECQGDWIAHHLNADNRTDHRLEQ